MRLGPEVARMMNLLQLSPAGLDDLQLYAVHRRKLPVFGHQIACADGLTVTLCHVLRGMAEQALKREDIPACT